VELVFAADHHRRRRARARSTRRPWPAPSAWPQRWAVAGSLPGEPGGIAKRAQVAASPTRKRWLVYGVGRRALAGHRHRRDVLDAVQQERTGFKRLTKQKEFLDGELRSYAQDRADIDALKEWEAGTIPLAG